MKITETAALSKKICENIAKVIAGKDEIIRLAVTALFADGHMLLDDVPGTGKTMLAKSLAKSIGTTFRRVQFTPDLLPSDLTGINYFNQKENDFTFREGPVFTNILLADEINRATPRTQSSLLECMEERQVTVDGRTYPLRPPYFVIATQNPVETQGTFPLPEAQLDRFLFRSEVGYPSTEDSVEILSRFGSGDPFNSLSAVCGADEIVGAQEAARGVYVHPDLLKYIVETAERTRAHPDVALGVSPRGCIALMRACRARAAQLGRNYATPEDMKYLAPHVFAHRLVLRDDFGGGAAQAGEIIREILSSAAVPTENWGGD